jgi:hypothetical protein
MSTLSTTNLKNPSSGSNNIVLAADGSTTIPTLSATTITGTSVRGGITSGVAVASTSGTEIDFAGIPSWVKRVTVMFDGVSTNGTSAVQIQLGDTGGLESSGYAGAAGLSQTSTTGSAGLSAGFVVDGGGASAATNVRYGACAITKLSGNTWVASGVFAETSNNRTLQLGGTKTLSDTLTQLRITTVNGTDTFDAGTINIMYEG